MCTACVAQGIGYVGGALGALQVAAYRARQRRRRDDGASVDASGEVDGPTDRQPCGVGAPAGP